MTHRYLELPFPGDVAAFDDRIAWIRSHMGGVQAAAIDIDTGATRLVTVGTHDVGRGSLAPIGGAIVATVGRHAAVEWFDAATGASVRKTEGALCGVSSRASLVVVRTSVDDGTRSIIEVDGTSERTLYVARQEASDVVLGLERVWIIQRKRLIGIPLSAGAMPIEIAVPENTSLVAWRDQVIVVEDLVTRDRIRARFHAIDGRELRELAIVDGEVDASSSVATLSKGDLIVLDELRETAPGKFTVVSWHKQGQPASTTDLPLLVSRASDLARIALERPAFEPDTRLAALRAAAKVLDFAIPPLLEKFLALHDGELGFRGLLERISIHIEVTGSTTTWSGSDPCLLGFAGNGGGDVVARYYYPAAHTPGAELPIVEWMHDDNTVEWVAQSFEIHLASRLRDVEEWANPVVQAIRARLDLPARREEGEGT